MNTSATLNDTVEFPPWRQLTAVNILLYVGGVLLPTTLVMNISVLIALMKSKVKYKPLLFLFGSLLVSVCVEKLIVCIGQCIISPNAFRYCLCDIWIVLVFQVPRVFFATYSIIIVTCVSLMQLCLMRGNLVNDLKHISFIMISVFMAIVWTFIVFFGNVLSNDPTFCYVYCTLSPFGLLRVNAKVLLSYIAFTLMPAFVITIIASIMALRIFKKKFIFRPDSKNEMELNRRMLLLPFLMAILQLCNSVIVHFVTVTSSAIVSTSDVGIYYGSVANVFACFEYFLCDIVHCLFFPLTLLYLYADVKKLWKKLMCKKCCC